MSKRDYYEILGVSKTASEAELKSAFRKLAMQCHPDRHPGDTAAEAKFKELNEAYQVLSDSQKRGAYDRYGHQAFEQGGGGGNPDFSDFMSDIFDSFFGDARRGGPRSANGRERGADLRYNLEIGLEDAFAGKNASIRVPTSIACEVCSGTGAKPGSKSRQCPTCGGHARPAGSSRPSAPPRPAAAAKRHPAPQRARADRRRARSGRTRRRPRGRSRR